jgi:hypothetical protein
VQIKQNQAKEKSHTQVSQKEERKKKLSPHTNTSLGHFCTSTSKINCLRNDFSKYKMLKRKKWKIVILDHATITVPINQNTV